MRPDVQLFDAATADGVAREAVAQAAGEARIDFVNQQALGGEIGDQFAGNRAGAGARLDDEAVRRAKFLRGAAHRFR